MKTLVKSKTLINQPKNEKQSIYLSETLDGFYLVDNHARMIWQGNKKLIVKAISFKEAVGKSFYLVSNNSAFGVIKIKSIKSIGLSDFKELEESHRITASEREQWFENKKTLFAYDFSFKPKFDPVRRVAIPSDVETLISKVEFLSEEEIPSFVENFKDSMLIEDFVSITEQPIEEKFSKSIDFFVKAKKKELFDIIQNKIQLDIKKMCKEDKTLNFVLEDNERLPARFITLYDLVLVKKKPVLVDNFGSVKTMQAFEPVKPQRTFQDTDLLLDCMFGS